MRKRASLSGFFPLPNNLRGIATVLTDRVTRRNHTSGREAKARWERPPFSSPNLAVLMLASIVL